jgi:SprT protein
VVDNSLPNLKQVAAEALNEAMARHPLPYVPHVIWKAYRVTAGMAYYRTGAIGLSTRVLRTPEAVRETLLHEYAHLLAVHRDGKRAANHGEFWRTAMRDLGLEPQVRHSYEVERNVPRQRVTYVCLRCGKPFVRARRLPKRQRYVHRDCGGDLRLHSVERVTGGTSGA